MHLQRQSVCKLQMQLAAKHERSERFEDIEEN